MKDHKLFNYVPCGTENRPRYAISSTYGEVNDFIPTRPMDQWDFLWIAALAMLQDEEGVGIPTKVLRAVIGEVLLVHGAVTLDLAPELDDHLTEMIAKTLKTLEEVGQFNPQERKGELRPAPADVFDPPPEPAEDEYCPRVASCSRYPFRS